MLMLKDTAKTIALLQLGVLNCPNESSACTLMQFASTVMRRPSALYFLPDTGQICLTLDQISNSFKKQLDLDLQHLEKDKPAPDILSPALAEMQSVLVGLNRGMQMAELDTLLQDILHIAMENWDDIDDKKNMVIAIELFHGWLHSATH